MEDFNGGARHSKESYRDRELLNARLINRNDRSRATGLNKWDSVQLQMGNGRSRATGLRKPPAFAYEFFGLEAHGRWRL